ncbi:MAG TPA: POTRA domain-containing protein, partial [Bacteroidota bacterium]|nr:POTRA domain-containing protein [Bacteroidota bacterium]
MPVAVLACAVLSAAAQTPPPAARYEIARLAFEGNAALTANELQGQMTTRETPGFLSRFLHNTISEKLGRKNEYLSLPTLAADLRRLRTYYENRGFFGAAIDTQLAYRRDEGEVDVTIRIAEGYRALIDTLAYLGIVNAPGTIWTDIQAAPRIAVGDPYSAQLL